MIYDLAEGERRQYPSDRPQIFAVCSALGMETGGFQLPEGCRALQQQLEQYNASPHGGNYFYPTTGYRWKSGRAYSDEQDCAVVLNGDNIGHATLNKRTLEALEQYYPDLRALFVPIKEV